MFGNPYLMPLMYGGAYNNMWNQTAAAQQPRAPATNSTTLSGAALQNAYAGLYFNNFWNQTQQQQQPQAQAQAQAQATLPLFGFPSSNQTANNPFAWFYLPWIRWYYCIQPMYYGMPPHPICFPSPSPSPSHAPADPSIATPAGGADAAHVPPSMLAMFPQMSVFARPMMLQQQQQQMMMMQQQQQQMAMMNPFAQMMMMGQQQQQQPQQQEQEQQQSEQRDLNPFDYAALVPNKGVSTVM